MAMTTVPEWTRWSSEITPKSLCLPNVMHGVGWRMSPHPQGHFIFLFGHFSEAPVLPERGRRSQPASRGGHEIELTHNTPLI